MIIILEGVDGSGKSTLAAQLQQEFGGEVFHEGPPPNDLDPLDYYGEKLERYRHHLDAVILDRFALGERVYGPIYRNVNRFDQSRWDIFDRLLVACGARHILCAPPYEVCHRAWKNRKGEMFTDDGKHRQVYELYHQLQLTTPGLIRYDWTQAGQLDSIRRWLHGTPVETLPPGYVGWPTAGLLFVGDRGSRPSGLTPNLPFFGVDNSSLYLTRALHIAGIPMFALTNAWHWKPGPTDGFFLARHVIPSDRFARVVALGNSADDALRHLHIPHRKVPHPQHHRRFKYELISEYAEMLYNACVI